MTNMLIQQKTSCKIVAPQRTRGLFLCHTFRLCVFACVLVLCFNAPSLSQKNENFTNPILAGFYPDPSICRVSSDYYLVTSSFSYFPGIPIFHSKDLANWKQIGHVMDRPEQLDLDGLGVSRGIFAPAIRYNDGVFYVTCTLVDKGGNFVVPSGFQTYPFSGPAWEGLSWVRFTYSGLCREAKFTSFSLEPVDVVPTLGTTWSGVKRLIQ